MHYRRRFSSDHRAVRIGRLTRTIVAATVLLPLACDHSKIGGGGSGSAGHPDPGAAGTIGGTAGNSGTAGTTGTGGDSSGIAGNAAGTAGDSGTAGTTGAAGAGPGSAGATGSAGDSGTAGATGAAGNTGSAGAMGSAGSGGATGSGGSGPGGNLIANGDFSDGATNWHTENGTGNVNNGAYCVGSPSGSTLVGWAAPSGSTLSLSGGYKLTFQASGGGTVHVKVGMAVDPFGADFEANDGVSNSLQTFMHTFNANDSNAGLAFTFMNAGTSTVCIDNVTLTAN